jgi:hypothetical protein
MTDDRLRVPEDDEYFRALGLAIMCFARLEWSAVWCCEKVQRGYVQTAADKTAGEIANDLVTFAAAQENAKIALSLSVAAAEFKRLVRNRNGLVHANTGTANLREQRLFRQGKEWTLEAIHQLADEFARADAELTEHYHHKLA